MDVDVFKGSLKFAFLKKTFFDLGNSLIMFCIQIKWPIRPELFSVSVA